MTEPRSPHPDTGPGGGREPEAGGGPSAEHRRGRKSADVAGTRAGMPPRRESGRVRPPGWRGWVGILGAAVLLALLFLFRQPLSEWLWPQTRAQQLRADAAQALLAGTLTAADGHGARELYEAALALDPDGTDARAGLGRVGEAALAQAQRALAERRYADAHRGLALARELAVPARQVDAMARALRDAEGANAGMERLLSQADAARAAGDLDGGDASALPLYQRVLALQPSHTQALEGREDTLADLLQQALLVLRQGDLVAAGEIIQRAREADPGHADLPGVLGELGGASQQRLRRADRDVRFDRLGPALEGYRAVLSVDPEEPGALRGLARVATAHARRSERMAADFRFGAAETALRQAHAISPDVPAIAEARQHMARARESQSRYGSKLTAAERERRLLQWLQQAAAAEARGDLLTPPGDSAFDKVRAAREIAPRDARVVKASARLLPAARACFDTALRGNRLARAGDCLDARAVLGEDDARLADSRRQLAQRWIAIGSERLGAGEMSAAVAALAAARKLDATAAGLEEFNERIRAAAAAD